MAGVKLLNNIYLVAEDVTVQRWAHIYNDDGEHSSKPRYYLFTCASSANTRKMKAIKKEKEKKNKKLKGNEDQRGFTSAIIYSLSLSLLTARAHATENWRPDATVEVTWRHWDSNRCATCYDFKGMML